MLRFLFGLLLLVIAFVIAQDVVINARRGVQFLRDITVGHSTVTTVSTIHPVNYPMAALAVVLALGGVALIVLTFSRRVNRQPLQTDINGS